MKIIESYRKAIDLLKIHLKKFKVDMILYFIGWLIDAVLCFATPILLGSILDTIVYYADTSAFLRLSLVTLIILIFHCALYYVMYYYKHTISTELVYDIKKEILKHFLYVEGSSLNDLRQGQFLNNINLYSDECLLFITQNVIYPLYQGLNIVFFIYYLFSINWVIGCLSLSLSIISVALSMALGAKTKQLSNKERKLYNIYISWLIELITSLKEFKLLNAKQTLDAELETQTEDLYNVKYNIEKRSLLIENLLRLFAILFQISAYVSLAYLAWKFNATIGTVVVGITFYTALSTAIEWMTRYYINFPNRMTAIEALIEFKNLKTEDSWTGTKKLEKIKHSVELQNITFAYNGTSQNVLKDLNLKIEAGTSVAMVGKSGSGKTTIANILVGFYSPCKGEIFIDGQKITNYTLDSIRRQIGYIQQDVFLFEGTLRENLLLGNVNASHKDLMEACDNAGVSEFLNELPNGLDTSIKDIKLSGGQRQRVAIARIYLRKPSLIIFDEATSSLDLETEKYLVEDWRKALKNNTTSIVISHRENIVRCCDTIAILNDGKIESIGSAKDIMNLAEYKNIFLESL